MLMAIYSFESTFIYKNANQEIMRTFRRMPDSIDEERLFQSVAKIKISNTKFDKLLREEQLKEPANELSVD